MCIRDSNTRSRCFLLGKERCLMASQAFHRFVLAQQLEFGFNVMVKLDRFPVAIHMAGLAFFAVLPLMLVDLEMTGHTFMRRSFIAARVSMAFVAFHIDMLAFKSKVSLC